MQSCTKSVLGQYLTSCLGEACEAQQVLRARNFSVGRFYVFVWSTVRLKCLRVVLYGVKRCRRHASHHVVALR